MPSDVVETLSGFVAIENFAKLFFQDAVHNGFDVGRRAGSGAKSISVFGGVHDFAYGDVRALKWVVVGRLEV